jgi:hypothetical protein
MALTRSLVVGVAVITLVACATTVERLNVRDWIGHKGDDLVRSWGPPHHVYQTADGSKEIGYFFEDHLVSGLRGPLQHRIRRCLVNFEVDSTGMITDATTTGTKCQIYPHEQMHPKG